MQPESNAPPKPNPCCAPEGAGLKPSCELVSPAAAADRIDAIDVVRGAALFGVLTVNLLMEFRVSIFAQFIPGLPPQGLEAWVESAVEPALELKAFALFSLLFALGIAVYVLQAASSTLRLRHYQYGPLEWVWRVLMYGRLQPLVTNGFRVT